MASTRFGAWLRCSLGLAALALVPAARAEAPKVGQVQQLSVISLALEVGSTGKESRKVVYAPPPGWYVRGHRVECTRKAGHSSYTVSTVPRDWSAVSEDKARESYKLLIDLAGKSHKLSLQSRFRAEQEQVLSALHKVRTSHHALVVEATAQGEGFLRGSGALHLTVTAELVYVGTADDLTRKVKRLQAGLE